MFGMDLFHIYIGLREENYFFLQRAIFLDLECQGFSYYQNFLKNTLLYLNISSVSHFGTNLSLSSEFCFYLKIVTFLVTKLLFHLCRCLYAHEFSFLSRASGSSFGIILFGLNHLLCTETHKL